MSAGRARVVAVAVLAGLVATIAGAVLEGPWLWICVALVAVATALGARADFREVEPRGVPASSLVLPVVACVSTAGLARLAGGTAWLVAAAVAGGTLVLLALLVERRLLGHMGPRLRAGSGAVVPLTVLLALTAFLAVATAVPGAVGDGTLALLREEGLALLAAADALVAFVLGYRLARIRATRLRTALVAAGTFAAVAGVGAALTRAWTLPRAVAPVLLAALFYLWSAYRAAAAERRGSWHWVWEYAALAVAGAIAVGWNLLLR